MNREALLYAIAFVGVIAAGVWFIAPRISGRTPTPRPAPHEFDVGPSETEPANDPIPDAPQTSWFELEVAAPQGGLRGPLHDVFGADVEPLTASDAGLQRLRIRPVEAMVSFGAVAHQWVHRSAASLKDGERIVLPLAAAPLIVRVREPNGIPAANVPVRLLPEVPGLEFRTDEGGALVLDHLAPGFVLVDLNSAERTGPVLRLRAGQDRDVTVKLDPAWEVIGRLTDREGAPIPDAAVVGIGPGGLLGSRAGTDAQGRFLWRGPAVARAALRIDAPGWSPVRLEATPPAVGPLRTDLGDVRPSARSSRIEGRVDAVNIEPDAHVTVEPAVAALVREVFGSGHALDVAHATPIAPDGSFGFDDVEADLPLRVRVRGTGVPLDQIVVGKPGETMSLDLFPPHGHTLHGQVLDHDGTPREGVHLLVSTQERDGNMIRPGDRSVVTGLNGRFRLLGVSQRTVFVRAYVDGRRSLLRQVTLPLAKALTLQLEPAIRDADRRVQGRVVDAQKRPLFGVTVRAAGMVTRTDREGRFVLEGVESLAPRIDLRYGYEPGPLPGAVDVAWHTLSRTTSLVPGGAPLELTLPRAGHLRMRLVDGLDEQPISFAHVFGVAGRDRRVVIDRGFATHDGEIVVPGLVAEGVTLSVFTHDRRWTGAVSVRPGVVTDLGTVPMSHGVRIEGTVLNSDQDFIAGALVGAFDEGWQRGADPAYERELLFRHARTAQDGTFRIEGFGRRQPGQLGAFAEAVNLAVWAPNHAPAALRVDVGDVPPGEAAKASISLETGVFLSIDLQEERVIGSSKPLRPIHGAMVDAEHARDGSGLLELWHWGMLQGPVASTTDWRRASTHLLFEARSEDGYLIGPIRPGPYDIWISHPKFRPFHQKLTVVSTGQLLAGQGFASRFLGRVSHFRFEMKPDRSQR